MLVPATNFITVPKRAWFGAIASKLPLRPSLADNPGPYLYACSEKMYLRRRPGGLALASARLSGKMQAVGVGTWSKASIR